MKNNGDVRQDLHGSVVYMYFNYSPLFSAVGSLSKVIVIMLSCVEAPQKSCKPWS